MIGLAVGFLLGFPGWKPVPAWSQETVRRPILAGTWYPADAKELRSTIDAYLQRARLAENVPPDAHLLGIVAPHAGLMYSGPVAAYAYRVVQEHPVDAVVVLAPSHRVGFEGVSVFREGSMATPLGHVPVHADLIKAIQKRCPDVHDYPPAHAREHAVEIQLPFLQAVLPFFRLVPLVFGYPSWETCERLAQALRDLSTSFRFLVVASTDLSHEHTDEEARRMDARVLEHLRHMQARELWQDLRSGMCEACGAAPLVTLMLYAQKMGAKKVSLLRYATSADVTGEKSRVVGYAAAALWHDAAHQAQSPAQGSMTPSPPALGVKEKAMLMALARETLEAKLFGKNPPNIDLSKLPPALQEPRGAFVTLKRRGQLRGCIGQIEARWPLAHTVARMALAAAFHDPRFPSMTPDEWKDVQLEISVLSPLVPLRDPLQVQVGTHGLYIRRDTQAGLLLPQVPVEQGWDRETFLRQTCRKAGLSSEAWKDSGTELFVFTAEVIHEK
ncbi:AmmeMemoRadiSam system protein B [Desulfosoma caldarium]|uniref:AmmeMemoRadiSam system protein B n=1 Tax=Desulfosoma caldarium TaxID=610254 RepID=UPI0014745AF3|nr:AmmeMemoRadiSam system protein B [Desulfosoma caldarium]